jgi:predicted Rossmann-fold nucleotide-binding protein
MRFSNAIVIAPGGVGTALETFYAWQLMQVGDTCEIPIIFLGKMWSGLLKWLKKEPLKRGYFEAKDMKSLYHAKSSKEAIQIIDKAEEMWKKGDKSFCVNYKKYKVK